VGLSSKKINNHFLCFGGGANFKNFSAKRPYDVMGLAFNHAVFNNNPANIRILRLNSGINYVSVIARAKPEAMTETEWSTGKYLIVKQKACNFFDNK
jgi:hypothetical protein